MKPVDHKTEMLETKLLRLFELLYSTGSVTRAAEQMGQSQPTVSIWLSKLRETLNDPLFVRTAEGMQPTPRAQALIEPARRALASIREISEWQPEFDPASASRKFRICMTDASHITLLPQILAHVRACAPQVSLEATRIDADTPRLMAAGEADLALGFIPDLESGFYQQGLFPQDWVCLVSARHPRLTKAITPKQYRQEAHVAITSGTGNSLLLAALKRHQVERRIVLEIPGFLGLPAILSTTDLIATLPRQIAETLATSGRVTVLPCPVAIPSYVVKQHWHARYHQDAASRWLRSVCSTLFLKEAPVRIRIRTR